MVRIVVTSSKLKGRSITPSHFIDQDLTNIWLDQSLGSEEHIHAEGGGVHSPSSLPQKPGARAGGA
jgi:hypothetical protein